MPMYSSWIGEKDSDDFFWDNIPDQKYRTGNTPGWLVPENRFFGLYYGPGLYKWAMETGRFECRQLDWGAWGVAVSRQECLDLWDQRKPGEDGFFKMDEWASIRAEIDAALEDGKTYVICVAERA